MEDTKVSSPFSGLISVYKKDDAASFDEALTSIWDNQILKPNQIVVIQDGTLTFELDKIINKWQQKLGDILVTTQLKQNGGLAKALNVGLELCSNELIARMDADDVALPERFLEQINFMDENPEISLLSSWIEEYDETLANSLGVRKVPETNSAILKFAKSRNPINHPAVVFKKSVVKSLGGYPLFNRAQDYALWSLVLNAGFLAANIQKVLLKMRCGKGMMDRRGFYFFKQEAKLIKFQKQIGFLTYGEYLYNLTVRFMVRVQPKPVKKIVYKLIKRL